ncbi:MAG: hypothetical protein NUV52_02845 [Candidatus Roizmanbacteria bacterium]|nr:hypothetical protein [Candidatus Roizmanbacteria bacterium]
MKVYYASATSMYEPSKKDFLIKKNITKHQSLLNGKKLSGTTRSFFEIQKQNIDKADCVIVEVTNPSIDIGGIVVYALTKGIPTLALVFENEKGNLPPMLAGNPSDSLFIEHYSNQNISICLRTFFEHVHTNQTRKGKVIVIDGGDGSGKATQVQYLAQYLKANKAKHRIYDFPRYFSSFHGSTIGRMLSGEFGTLDSISPYLASLAYALDRASLKEEMDDFLRSGGIMLCNRYATSNMAHQSAKIIDPVERKKYLAWVAELEYKIHKIPREDIVIYLYVPWKVGYDLTAQRSKEKNIKLDIAEKDIEHRKAAERMYLELCKTNSHWVKINCLDNNNHLRTREDIHTEIVKTLKKKKLIP